MSYAQAIKFSRNHRKDRFHQPIVLWGYFHEAAPCACVFGPHFAKAKDTAPDYYDCLRCGARIVDADLVKARWDATLQGRRQKEAASAAIMPVPPLCQCSCGGSRVDNGCNNL